MGRRFEQAMDRFRAAAEELAEAVADEQAQLDIESRTCDCHVWNGDGGTHADGCVWLRAMEAVEGAVAMLES